MAWNTDDHNKKDPKDIWGRRHEETGPPDLDRIFKELLNKLFGKSGKGGYGRIIQEDLPSSFNPVAWVVAVLLFLYVVSGIYIVEPAEQAVVTRFGRYVRTVDPGPHWHARFIEKKRVVNVQQVYPIQHEGRMLTRDENIVRVEIAVQFHVLDPKAYLFNVVDPRNSLRQATESALRSVIGSSTLDDILTSGRAEITQKITEQTEALLAAYNTGLAVTDITMQPARAPEEVKEAFDDVIKAQEDEVREVNRAETYARSREPIARGTAKRAKEEAEAYKKQTVLLAKGNAARFLAILPEYRKAPEVTRERLYLSTMADILGSTPKVLMDGHQNQMVYLPLEKLLEMQNKPQSTDVQENSTNNAAMKAQNKALSEAPGINSGDDTPRTSQEFNPLRNRVRAERRN